jgi:pantetheine-phosphate adenylyltransferase
LKICVYPGSFDPVTMGHLDIILRSSKVFDKLIVAVGNNINKQYSFNLEERVKLLKTVLNDKPFIEIDSFSGLLIDFMKKKKAKIVIKGLRAVSDFEYELQMALLNKSLDPSIETLFMASNINYSYLSSSAVKELVRNNGNISGLVPDCIINNIYEKFKPDTVLE